jgi:hypothetical protein
MEDLIARIVAAAVVKPEIAKNRSKTILAFLREGDPAEVDACCGSAGAPRLPARHPGKAAEAPQRADRRDGRRHHGLGRPAHSQLRWAICRQSGGKSLPIPREAGASARVAALDRSPNFYEIVERRSCLMTMISFGGFR